MRIFFNEKKIQIFEGKNLTIKGMIETTMSIKMSAGERKV